MNKGNTSALALLAVIFGASGLGFGAFSIIYVQMTDNGDDGTDGNDGRNGTDATIENLITNNYYCSSATEIQNAIDSIGSDSGKIFIIKSITVSTTINIDGGGNYIIQGEGASSINISSNVIVFNVTGASFCTIRDLTINTHGLTLDQTIINVNETNNNPVFIENVQFIGDVTNKDGIGIEIESEFCSVVNCYFFQIDIGISLLSTGDRAVIYGNKFYKLKANGINCLGSYNIIENNHIFSNEIGNGIRIYLGSNNIISSNIIGDVYYSGVVIYGGSYNTVSTNQILGKMGIDGEAGIRMWNGANWNNINGNECFDFTSGLGTRFGIYIGFGCSENTIVGNSCLNNDADLRNDGDLTTLSGNNYVTS